MSSDYKISFTLKQHTPLIHFQGGQNGATLRATELKPKFDKFLKEYVFSRKVPEEFLIDKDKDVLNYKVKIKAKDSNIKEITNKTYFGNMGKQEIDEDYRKSVFTRSTVCVEFFSFKAELLEKIKEFFPSFMAITNFGTRQSKGFGSFYIDKKDKNYIKPKEALDKIKRHYIYADTNKSSEKIFSFVEVIYPLMKSGINFPDYPKKEIIKNGRTKKVPDPSQGRGLKATYYKSFLFEYMLKKDMGNEKRFIKENFFNPKVRIEPDNIKKYYVRAMLGVCDGIEFKDHERKGKISYKSKDIERFKSPLTFKIFDNQMFIIAEKVDERVFNTTFTFSYSFKNKTFSKDIPTPTKEKFDLKDFLFSFADYFNTLEVKKDQNKMNFLDKQILEAKILKFKKKQDG